MTIDDVIRLLNFGFVGAGLAAIVLVPVFLVQAVRRSVTTRRPGSFLTGWSARLFLVCVVLAMLFATSGNLVAGRKIHEILQDPETIVVAVDGRPASNPAQVLTALRGVSAKPAHHSHPIAAIPVVLRRDGVDTTLLLSRDSDNPREYWVDIPRSLVEPSDGLGRVETAAFDAYPGRGL